LGCLLRAKTEVKPTCFCGLVLWSLPNLVCMLLWKIAVYLVFLTPPWGFVVQYQPTDDIALLSG
jgi:hypothetical protein